VLAPQPPINQISYRLAARVFTRAMCVLTRLGEHGRWWVLKKCEKK
jgi:hypothetical protein